MNKTSKSMRSMYLNTIKNTFNCIETYGVNKNLLAINFLITSNNSRHFAIAYSQTFPIPSLIFKVTSEDTKPTNKSLSNLAKNILEHIKVWSPTSNSTRNHSLMSRSSTILMKKIRDIAIAKEIWKICKKNWILSSKR